MSDTSSPPGIFAQWQPRYAEHRLPTFPVDGASKKPAVKGYLYVGLPGSHQLALKFGSIDAFGIVAGARNRITILDVDTPDERVLADAMARVGQSPFIVRSGSGNHQAWYRHAGESRRIRPNPNEPIDILGGGLVIAPPSRGAKGTYTIVQGTMDDLDRLPPMRHAESRTYGDPRARGGHIPKGQRNKTLHREACFQVRHVDDFDSLVDKMRGRNDDCEPPLPDAEVIGICRSVWKWQQEGRNWIGAGQHVQTPFEEIDELAAREPDALALLLFLRRHHNDRPKFVLSKATAGRLGWTLPRFKAARMRLVVMGYLVCLHEGGGGPHDPPIYAFGGRGTISYPNLNTTPSPSSPLRH